MKPIILRASMQDTKGVLIPKGIIAYLTCEIYEEKAVFYFNDAKITRKFAMAEINGDKEKNKQQKTFYNQRLQKALTRYEGLSQEEIKEVIVEQLTKLGVKISEYGKR